jgi:hypothetical protein
LLRVIDNGHSQTADVYKLFALGVYLRAEDKQRKLRCDYADVIVELSISVHATAATFDMGRLMAMRYLA